VKLRIHNDALADDLAQVKAVRKAVGRLHGDHGRRQPGRRQDAPLPGPHWTYHRARETAQALAEYDVAWLEEPLPRHSYDDLRRLTASSPIPIAGGENNQQLHDLERLLADGCYSILQPDVTLCEGLLAIRALAASAQRRGVLVNPHSWGDPVGTGREPPPRRGHRQHLVLRVPARSARVSHHAYQSTLKTPWS
jgi:L-alanine-DL-glutamate epimerase-like enolase superfamily enzyme